MWNSQLLVPMLVTFFSWRKLILKPRLSEYPKQFTKTSPSMDADKSHSSFLFRFEEGTVGSRHKRVPTKHFPVWIKEAFFSNQIFSLSPWQTYRIKRLDSGRWCWFCCKWISEVLILYSLVPSGVLQGSKMVECKKDRVTNCRKKLPTRPVCLCSKGISPSHQKVGQSQGKANGRSWFPFFGPNWTQMKDLLATSWCLKTKWTTNIAQSSFRLLLKCCDFPTSKQESIHSQLTHRPCTQPPPSDNHTKRIHGTHAIPQSRLSSKMKMVRIIEISRFWWRTGIDKWWKSQTGGPCFCNTVSWVELSVKVDVAHFLLDVLSICARKLKNGCSVVCNACLIQTGCFQATSPLEHTNYSCGVFLETIVVSTASTWTFLLQLFSVSRVDWRLGRHNPFLHKDNFWLNLTPPWFFSVLLFWEKFSKKGSKWSKS